ncbi:UBX domain-containing protein 10 [Epinephelus fuscoguttatus]|uniref:UBX domain-containing protein 10 n=1 Tax=Epinephelus fuscoguttatus TaxID=293821 RepID=UPI0020D0D4D8|nr:UBX domain-containing protein 10 [Epinephelus fuscoguttatus]
MQGRTFWLSMHLTRPKSSKGRSRPAMSSSTSPHPGAGDSTQRPPVSPDSAVYSRPDRNLRSQSQPTMWQAGQLSQEQVVQMLQHAPAAPPLSLNKYKVLPSIGRRRSEVGPGGSLDKEMSMLSLSDDVILQHRHRHEEPDPSTVKDCEVDQRAKPPDPGPVMTTEAGASGSLLLAVRAPCGRRFQQHFEPTDTLLMVRASAELRYGVQYGDASIETMDMPRRTFTDLDMTLAQCGILNRSVLCISQNEQE